MPDVSSTVFQARAGIPLARLNEVCRPQVQGRGLWSKVGPIHAPHWGHHSQEGTIATTNEWSFPVHSRLTPHIGRELNLKGCGLECQCEEPHHILYTALGIPQAKPGPGIEEYKSEMGQEIKDFNWSKVDFIHPECTWKTVIGPS